MSSTSTPFLDWSLRISRAGSWSDRAVVLGGAAALALIIISKHASHDRLISPDDVAISSSGASSSSTTGTAGGLSDTYGRITDSDITRDESIDSSSNTNGVACSTATASKKPIDYPVEIQAELYSRVISFFGKDGFAQLRESFVIVVGLGGVGSHCANMLVRSGVGSIRLIDFDQVTLSSLNRHALAALSDVGQSKAEVMRRRLLEAVPWSRCEAVAEMFRLEDADRLLAGSPTMVIDCIDDVSSKADLISFCSSHHIPIVTSMGAGGKSDPTKLRISSLYDVINDPLAQKIRWKLRKMRDADLTRDVVCVYSVEKPVCDLLPLDEEQKLAPQDYGTADYLRLRVIPVLGTSPSIFGHALASFVLCSLGGKMYQPEVGERMSKNLKHKVHQVLRKEEMRRFHTEKDINIDDEDLEFIVQQVWRSRCAATNRRFGGHVCLTLTRWDPALPPTPYNLVLLMQNEALRLAELGPQAFPAETVTKISSRLQWARRVCDQSWDTLDHTGGKVHPADGSSIEGRDDSGRPHVELTPYPDWGRSQRGDPHPGCDPHPYAAPLPGPVSSSAVPSSDHAYNLAICIVVSFMFGYSIAKMKYFR